MLARIFTIVLILPLLSTAEILEGIAKNKSGDLVYIEKHNIKKDEQGLNKSILVEYKKSNGEIFATMTSDFSQHKNLPETDFEDFRFKTKYLFRVKNSQVEFEEFKNGQSLSKKTFPLEESMVVSQGFDNFILTNFSKMESSPVEFKFGVLDSKDFYKLTGYRQPVSSTDEIHYGIKATNWFLGIFAGELKVVYDSKDRKLKKFSGRSNILNDRGQSQDVDINYTWKQSDEK